MKRLWKIYCDEDRFPGMWQRWFKHQCVGIGWYSKWGFKMTGQAKNRGWSRARNALEEIKIGDYVIVALHSHRVGRLGMVTGKLVSDDDWEPLVPKSSQEPDGEMGRRIQVRWDLTIGPDDRDMVVSLPETTRFKSELRPTLCKVSSFSVEKLKLVMNDPANWVGLLSHFGNERALSDYIAAYPHHLEDGLQEHPNEKLRERVFKDRTRADLLLIDRDDCPVIVECKQGAPTIANIEQVRRYMKLLSQETGQQPRAMLVHGGSLSLPDQVRDEAAKNPRVKILRYKLSVDFDPCG